MRSVQPAAYHGEGFVPRRARLGKEIETGASWASRLVDCEDGELREVLLRLPDPKLPAPSNPNRALHLDAVDFAAIRTELERLAETLATHGIGVQVVDDAERREDEEMPTLVNSMFARDVFLMTPEGALVGRMAAEARKGEEVAIAAALARLRTPILRTIGGSGTFEGADALWIDPEAVLVGTGNRTNRSGFLQVREALAEQSVRCVECPLPPFAQHLGGVLRILDRDLALTQGGPLSDAIRAPARAVGIELAELGLGMDIPSLQALDMVTIAPRAVIVGSGAVPAIPALRRLGVEIVADVPTINLLNAAGGLGCAVASLDRRRSKDRCPN